MRPREAPLGPEFAHFGARKIEKPRRKYADLTKTWREVHMVALHVCQFFASRVDDEEI